MGFTQDFRKANQKLAASTVNTYLQQLKRIAKLAGREAIPESGAWLSKKPLFDKIKKLPVSTQKNLATAAVKASKIYKVKFAMWERLMRTATGAYEKKRDGRQKSVKEKALWFDYKELYKGGLRLWQALKKSDDWTFRDFRKAQQAYICLLYGKHTPRLLETLVRPGHKGKNQLRRKGKGFDIILRDYKTAKSRGPSTFKLDSSLAEPTKIFTKTGDRLLNVPNVFVNAKGQALSKASFSKLITASVRAAGLKGVSAQLLRVFKASSAENREIMNKAAAIQAEFGHGQKQQKQYSKK